MKVAVSNVDDDRRRWIETVFAEVDSRDVEAVTKRITADGEMTFGNAEPMRGHDAIRAGNEFFLGSIEGISHEIITLWEIDGTFVVRLSVTYTLPGGDVLTLPSCSVITAAEGGLISRYQVYFDPGPVMERLTPPVAD